MRLLIVRAISLVVADYSRFRLLSGIAPPLDATPIFCYIMFVARVVVSCRPGCAIVAFAFLQFVPWPQGLEATGEFFSFVIAN